MPSNTKKPASKRSATSKPAPKPISKMTRLELANELQQLGLPEATELPLADQRSLLKDYRGGEAPRTAKAKRSAELKNAGRFLLSENPDTFRCSSCKQLRPSSSFPTVKSGEPELRKDECRSCRTARNDQRALDIVAGAEATPDQIVWAEHRTGQQRTKTTRKAAGRKPAARKAAR